MPSLVASSKHTDIGAEGVEGVVAERPKEASVRAASHRLRAKVTFCCMDGERLW